MTKTITRDEPSVTRSEEEFIPLVSPGTSIEAIETFPPSRSSHAKLCGEETFFLALFTQILQSFLDIPTEISQEEHATMLRWTSGTTWVTCLIDSADRLRLYVERGDAPDPTQVTQGSLDQVISRLINLLLSVAKERREDEDLLERSAQALEGTEFDTEEKLVSRIRQWRQMSRK